MPSPKEASSLTRFLGMMARQTLREELKRLRLGSRLDSQLKRTLMQQSMSGITSTEKTKKWMQQVVMTRTHQRRKRPSVKRILKI
jgi:hypothetical protein